MSASPEHRERRRRRAVLKHRQARALRVRRATYPRDRWIITVPLAYRAAVERLTNRQRSAWGRSRYPGSSDHDPRKVLRFAD